MTRKNELTDAIRHARRALIGVALISGAVNVLYLTGSFYMLEVYDRVLPSRSLPTLVGISIVAVMLYIFQGVLDVTRSRVLSRVGGMLDARLSARIFDITSQLPLVTAGGSRSAQPLRDLDTIRGFVSGPGPSAFFDLPWTPIYLAICFAFHWMVGTVVLCGAIVIVLLSVLAENLARAPAQAANRAAEQRQSGLDAVRTNAEVVRALGMGQALLKRWTVVNNQHRQAQQSAADTVTGLGGLAKSIRLLLQSGVLALGAYLVIQQQATAGIIIASSILSSRALSPAEQVVANWKGFLATRQSWQRLSSLLQKLPEEEIVTQLPLPRQSLSAENISMRLPNQERAVLMDISFQLEAGQSLGIIGPSASGKSTLARVIAGVWQAERGKVCLDGAEIRQWSRADIGKFVGYLPQDVELFSGTIAENISRFADAPPSEDVIAAARAAGVHEMIVAMPQGYETQIGDGGSVLSAGQRQRIGLARALYGNPFLLVLDEPNSNLDAQGDSALAQAIAGVRMRGGVVVVITHRPSILASCEMVMVLMAGRISKYGRRDEVLQPAGRVVPPQGQSQNVQQNTQENMTQNLPRPAVPQPVQPLKVAVNNLAVAPANYALKTGEEKTI